MLSKRVTIPDLLSTCNWECVQNPYLHEVQADAEKWFESLNLFDSQTHMRFKKYKLCLLAALMGPADFGRDHLRILCDLMHLYFAFDRLTDAGNARDIAFVVDCVTGELKGAITPPVLSLPPKHNLGSMTRQFIERTLSVVGADMVGVEIFVEEMCAFVCSVTEENKDRARGHVRNIEEYLFLRRKTCGARPTFYFLALGMNIPKHVFEHPTMRSLIDCATDLIAVINDMHSYGLEVSTGLADHNILTIIMHEYRVDAQAAVWWLSGYAAKGVAQFKLDSQALPSWGPHVDNNIQEFVRMVAQCVKGSDAWSYETERYYGKKGGRIQRTRKVALPSRAGRLSLLFTNNR